MTDESKAPERIFALPYHSKDGSAGIWSASPHVHLGAKEFVSLSAVHADSAKFGVVPVTRLEDEDGALATAYRAGAHDAKRKIKRLEWQDYKGNGYIFAETLFGQYTVEGHTLHTPDMWWEAPVRQCESEEAAKAAAQTHFETMIGDCYE